MSRVITKTVTDQPLIEELSAEVVSLAQVTPAFRPQSEHAKNEIEAALRVSATWALKNTQLVSDDAIANAQAQLWRGLRIVAEPGGAAAFSAILSGAYKPAPGERVAIVISGGNTAAVNFDATY